MADPLTLIFAIIFVALSTARFTAKVTDSLRKIQECEPELQKQLDEIEVLDAVLEECKNAFPSNVRIPRSAEEAIRTCVRSHRDLVGIMEQIRRYRSERPSQISKLLHTARIVARENERKAAYNAYRDSVLLLRDLSSEVRMSQQLVDMSAGITQIVPRYSDEEDFGSYTDHPDGQDHHDQENDDDRSSHKNEHGMQVDAYYQNPKPRYKAAVKEVFDLLQTNFTRNVTIVIETSAELDLRRTNCRPGIAKLDTGCEENLVSLEFLKEGNIKADLLVPIQNEHKIEFQGIDGVYTPEFEVQLSWYYTGKDTKIRHAKFYVVRDPPFNILIGTKRFSHEFVQDFRIQSSALILATRQKTKAEEEAERAKRKQQRKTGLEMEMAQLQESIAARKAQQARLKRDSASSGSSGAATEQK